MGVFWLAGWMVATLAQQPVLSSSAARQIEALEAAKAARTPAQQKIASSCLDAAKMRLGEPVAQGVPTLRVGVDVDRQGAVLVDIRADVTDALLQQIEAVGGTTVNRQDAYRSVRARVPLDQLERLAELPEVGFIKPADLATTNQASTLKVNTSEGDVAHRAALARSTFGIDGTGIGIGVLSDGVDSLASRQASGDLPATVTVLPGQAGSGDEGTAMLEIVHDLAPGASLYFATAFAGQASFAANIQALCNAGANIIVDDVFYYAEAVFQDGIVAQGVTAAMANGCHYFSSAGNSGNLDDERSGVWEGDFVPAASAPAAVGGTVAAFNGANSDGITLDPPSFITLTWSDPQGASGDDYDLYLLDPTLTAVLASSTSTQTGTQDPYEQISSSGINDLNNRLVILKSSGASRFLHLNTNRGRLEYATSGQISGHTAVDGAFSVAAVNVATAGGGAFTGGASNPVETFSSDGPRRVFYQANGTPITPGNFSSTGGAVRQKPDVAAADGVATSTPGYNPFYGTSAAAPHAAAIAALVLATKGGASSLTASQLRQYLTATALDIEASGVDRDSGSGILDAYAAVYHTLHAFTDDPLVAGVTPLKVVHITELRARIDVLRTRIGLATFAWTDSILTAGTSRIRAVHITEMRTALAEVYVANGRTPPTYTHPTLAAGMPIKAVDITELRAAVAAQE